MTGEGPLFNLKAVVQQTGLKPDTLRAWEHRYGLPSPVRSHGRQRLYTQRDIEAVRWLMARQQEGLNIARAVDHWRQIEAGGGDPLVAPVPPNSGSAVRSHPGGTLEQLRQGWLAACLAYDEQCAERAAAEAFALYPPETVCLELLQWALRETGVLWQQGTATVQQEHFVSALAVRQLDVLLSAAPPSTRRDRILAACPPQEYHTFGLLLLTLLLRRRGWPVVFLGADVPAERLDAAVSAVRPDLILLAAQRLPSAASLLVVAQALHGGTPIGYGGAVFNSLPSIRPRIPGFFLGESVEAAAGAVESLFCAPHSTPAGEPRPPEALVALEHFRERRPSVEARLRRMVDATGLSAEYVAQANGEFGLHLEAALALGDIALLDADIASVQETLIPQTAAAGAFARYLRAYSLVAGEQLDVRGEPIRSWLKRATGS